MSDLPEFVPVLISRREIEVLERVAARLHSEPGMVQEWAMVVTLIGSAKRAHAEAGKHHATVEAVRCALSA